MFQFKGTIIRPNIKTQYSYIQTVHTHNVIPYYLQIVLTLKVVYKLFADVFKMYIYVINCFRVVTVKMPKMLYHIYYGCNKLQLDGVLYGCRTVVPYLA